MGLDTKTYWLTDRQSQCDFDFDLTWLHRDPASRKRRRNGSLKSETVKYGREYHGTRTRERLRWEDPAAYTKDRPVLSSERAPHKNKTVNCQLVIAKYLIMSPRWGSIPRLTDWLTVSRNVTLTLTWNISRTKTRMEQVLGSLGGRVQPKIYCELL
jgi:hypothetical protein